jgi:hypothetical protein
MEKENVVCTQIHNGIVFSLKNKEILSSVTKWMNLEVIMLNKISQRHKRANTAGFHLY